PDSWQVMHGVKLYSIKVLVSEGSVFDKCENLIEVFRESNFAKEYILRKKTNLKDMSIYTAFEGNKALGDKENLAKEFLEKIYDFKRKNWENFPSALKKNN